MRRLAVCGALLVAFSASASPSAAVPRAGARRHARLVKSIPAANDTLKASPAAIKLWFSESIELGVARVKLVGQGNTSIATGRLGRIPGEDARTVMVAVTKALTSGTYVVQWTAPAEDGHPTKGAYTFVVAAAP
jgi:methionine-rich copper-binding protein CopC